MVRSLAGALAVLVFAVPAAAEPARPRLERKLIDLDPATLPKIVNSRTIFMNRCKGGCKVTPGDTDSRIDRSSIGGGQLAAFAEGDKVWGDVMTCMKATFSRFNVDVTDVDPGPLADHFEIMVGGQSGSLGLPPDVGGIAEYACVGPGQCAAFVPNALVFVFDVWGSDAYEICATAAQELAHTWSLDHVTDPSDPMTYANYNGMRQYKDGVTCGSDCDYSCPDGSTYCNAFGFKCTGSGTTGSHICMSTGTSTQNDVQTITNLFGAATAKAPTLELQNPGNLSGQTPGFSIDATCSGPDPIQEVDIEIDGVQKQAFTNAGPYHYAAAGVTDGLHRVTVICGSTAHVVSVEHADILVGAACNKGVCASGFTCYDEICIAGPQTAGGLGAACNSDADCKNGGTCAFDGQQHLCTLPCDPGNSLCPDGFGCLDAGTMNVCWLGYDDGGCCDTSGSRGSLLLALGLGVVLVTRRKPRGK